MKTLSQNHPNILVIDEDPEARRVLRDMLSSKDYRLQEVATAAEALAQMETLPPDLIILSLELPDLNGIDVIRQLRLREHSLPVITLSSNPDTMYKLRAFDAGADDFINKPFLAGELIARLRVALRRILPTPPETKARVFRSKDIEVDFDQRRVSVSGRIVHLTPIEYNLLRLLIRHANRVLSYHLLLREIWGEKKKSDTQYLRVYVGQLRRKLERDPARPRFLHNEPGIGYRFQTL